MSASPVSAGHVRPLVRTLARCPDPIELFAACTAPDALGTALLETAETSTGRGGRSLIVARSALLLRCIGRTVSVDALTPNGRALLPWLESGLGGRAALSSTGAGFSADFGPLPSGSEEERLHAASPTDVVRRLMNDLVDELGQPTTAPLVVGTFSWDLLGSYEQLPQNDRDLCGWPEFELWLPEQMIWLDHDSRTTTLVAHVYGGSATDSYADAIGAIERLATATNRACSARGTEPEKDDTPHNIVAPDISTDMDDKQFAALVERLREHIVAGDVFQIVPSRTFSTPCPDPLAAFRQLRLLNPSPYMFFLRGTGVLFGATPETALMVESDRRRVHIRPIAGTRPRGKHPDGTLDLDLDGRLEAELRLNEKEVAEHMMLVDLARNDIARVSVAGTRAIERLLDVERYSHVMHLVSHVSGQLRPDLDALHAYVATMNMGTLVGAPKVKAAELLRRYEATKRGPYGGAVGYYDAGGSMDSGIVIRAALVHNGMAHVRAGAGVVYDSDPLEEAHETRRKAQAVLEAISRANR